MELKKYVMNTVTKRIYQFEKQTGTLKDFYRCIDEDLKWAILYAEDLTNCHKTSDNILDLVEVGDLVEAKAENEHVVVRVDRQNNGTIYTYNDFIHKHFITAIYKRQSNGDYKRYEVEA
jgi:hypothetical protein